MKEIVVVTTGGTIGSALNGDQISVASDSGHLSRVLSEVAKSASRQLRIVPVLNKLSENFSPADWAAVLDQLLVQIEAGSEAIVVTHGTDTLHYTASYASQFIRNLSARVSFTGAYYSPDRPDSDAKRNVLAAVAAATSDRIPFGVYAAFGASDASREAMVTPAAELVPMRYDELLFRRQFSDGAPNFTPSNGWLRQSKPVAPYEVDVPKPSASALLVASQRIYMGMCYPGDAARLWRHLPMDSVLIIEAYHGGTASLQEGPGGIPDLARARPDLTICLASIPSPYIPVPYETSVALSGCGVQVLKDVQPHIAYVCALTRLAAGTSASEALSPLRKYRITVN